jgi:Xaa-Pro aminopeptidase
MRALGVDTLLLSLGADLPWLTGYQAPPLERLTMLVIPVDAAATLVVPRLEAPGVVEQPDIFALRPWEETEDPVGIVAGLVGAAGQVAISDRAWAMFVLALQARLPDASWRPSSAVTGPPRAVDEAARSVIAAAGYGPAFIHRTGHGIGLEEHEDPHIVAGNALPLVPGHSFSVEPGIYLSGRFGARIEDIVIATETGPRPLNHVSHDLTVVEA